MKKLTLYYILLVGIVCAKAGQTLYEKSVVVHHGFAVSEYQQQQRTLLQQRAAARAELAVHRSLTTLQNSGFTAEYTPIKSTLTISATAQVASLQ